MNPCHGSEPGSCQHSTRGEPLLTTTRPEQLPQAHLLHATFPACCTDAAFPNTGAGSCTNTEHMKSLPETSPPGAPKKTQLLHRSLGLMTDRNPFLKLPVPEVRERMSHGSATAARQGHGAERF